NAPAAGVLAAIQVKSGESVKPGSILGEIGAGEPANQSTKPAEKPAEKAPETKKEEPKAAAPAPAPKKEDAQSGPAARKMMADNNVAPGAVSGTGKDGRVTKGDVIDHL